MELSLQNTCYLISIVTFSGVVLKWFIIKPFEQSLQSFNDSTCESVDRLEKSISSLKETIEKTQSKIIEIENRLVKLETVVMNELK